MWGRLRDEKGQSVIIIALGMVAMLAFSALVIDSGYTYAQRRQMQNAADAGAFAGARELALGGTRADIYQRIQEYSVTRNGAETFEATFYPGGEAVDNVAVPPPAGSRGVVVTTTTTFPTFFAGVINREELGASANAAAQYGAVGSMTGGVYPLAVEWEDFVYDTTYDIFAGGGPGNWGWISWVGSPSQTTLYTSLTPPGDSETYTNPDDPADHTLSVGDWVHGSTGVMNSACIRAALDYFVDSQTPITVVVWDEVRDPHGHNLDYRIAGFAAFVLEDYHLPHKRITGRFIQWVTAGDWGGTTDYGLSTVKLTEP